MGKRIILLGMLLLLVACKQVGPTPIDDRFYGQSARCIQVDAQGNIDLKIQEGLSYRLEVTEGDELLQRYWIGSKLYLRAPKTSPDRKPCRVYLYAPVITAVSYQGPGSLDIRQWRTRQARLEITAASTARVQGNHLPLSFLSLNNVANARIMGLDTASLEAHLMGRGAAFLEGERLGLDNLSMEGTARLHAHWISECSPQWDLRDRSRLEVAGIVGRAEIRLRDQARLDARYLRAEKLKVHAQDFTRAQVWARSWLHLWAEGQGEIAYYRRPRKLLNTQLYDAGRILSMVDLETGLCRSLPEPYRCYEKQLCARVV